MTAPSRPPVASPPCMLHEVDSNGSVPVDPEQARDVARWRKAARERLIANRLALSPADRALHTQAIIGRLDALIATTDNPTVSVYWPIRGEPDLRAWMKDISNRGVRVALPVALVPGEPLIFREWIPGARLARGLWKIPYPADSAKVSPTVVIAPLVGFDRECFRLGYGGGFFDRTLAALTPKPLAIGVGYPGAAIATIYPQPYDIPMDHVVTGTDTLERGSLV